MNKETIHVVLASNDNYAQPLGTAIYSMLDNFRSQEYTIQITVLDGDISEKSKKKIINITEQFNAAVRFVSIPKEKFSMFPLIQYFSHVAYYRYFIPDVLEEEVTKAIYIDCDTMVLGDISEFHNVDIGDNFLGAIRDNVGVQVLKTNTSLYKEMKKYFNSGVLIMNLKKMRSENFVEKCLALTVKHAHELQYADQDVLNYLTIDNWYEIPNSWNFQIDRSQGEIKPTPKLIHYTTSYKPWHRFYHNYYQKQYMSYLKRAWPGYVIKPVTYVVALKQLLKYIPGSIHFVRLLKKSSF